MMIIQGRNVSWNKTTVPRKAKQAGKKNKVILTTFKSFRDEEIPSLLVTGRPRRT